MSVLARPRAPRPTPGGGAGAGSAGALPVVPPLQRGDVVRLGGPVLLAAALCLIGITGRSLGFDEGATVAIVTQHGHALWRAIAHDGGNMSGWYLLLHVLTGAFGDGPWVLRLPSLAFAAITPALVGLIGLELFGDRRVAGIAAWLSAVSLPLVYWGQTARGYAAMTALGCLGMLAFVRLLRGVLAGEEGWLGAAVVYVVATALAAYCGFIVLLIVPVQLLAAALLPGGWRLRARVLTRVAGALGALALLCAPLVVLAVRRGSGQLFWVPRPEHQVDTQVMQMLTSSGLQSTFHRVFTTTPGWIATAVVLLGMLALCAADRSPQRWGPATVLTWVIAPGLLAFLVSLVAQPLFVPRNLIISAPAVALALAALLADRRLPRVAAGLGVALALLIRAVPVIAAVDVSPEPWQPVVARVLAAARPGDCIAFYPEDARNVFRWYAAREHALRSAPRSVLPGVGWAVSTPYVEIYRTLTPARVAALRGSCRRMWLVSSHEGQPTGPVEVRAHRAQWLALRADLERAFGAAPVRSYGWASTIHVQLLPGRGAPG